MHKKGEEDDRKPSFFRVLLREAADDDRPERQGQQRPEGDAESRSQLKHDAVRVGVFGARDVELPCAS